MKKSDKIFLKIITGKELPAVLQAWRKHGHKIVFTNGCFDFLHAGHIEYLSKASDLGDKLIIGLNSDLSVKKIKGPSRPVNDEKTRSLLLASLMFVDAVSLFDEDTPYNLIKVVQPDVMVKGGDYKPEEIAGFDIVAGSGGKVITLDYVEGYSSSGIIQKIKRL